MVVVQIIGGLGNQMFQYAVAKALALEKKQELRLDLSRFDNYTLHNYALNNFNIKSKPYKKPNKYIDKFIKKTHYKEKDFAFNEEVCNLKGNSIFLYGYFQSEKYFLKHKNSIRKDFQIITPLKDITKKTLVNIQKVNSVSLHIRRGDYLTNLVHNTNKENYYKNAIKLIEEKVENPEFYIFSDDIEWVKQNFNIKYPTVYIDFNDALTNFEDIKLMASCKHNIIANSSFSWWSAWLNENKDKIVIAPKQWFNDSSRNTKDIIPNSWIKI